MRREVESFFRRRGWPPGLSLDFRDDVARFLARVHPPGFLHYLLRSALPVLVPEFPLISLLFFSRWRVF